MKNFLKKITGLFTFLTLGFLLIAPAHAYPPKHSPVCDYTYRIENDQVFFCNGGNEEWMIEGADPESFEIIDFYYAKDKNAVYCSGAKHQADPDTFAPIEGSTSYYKDDSSVFWVCSALQNSDPKTFELLGSDFGQDKNNTYYQGVILGGVDQETFEVLKHAYAKDQYRVYFRYNILTEADAETFETKAYDDYSEYCEDSPVDAWDKNAYYLGGFKVCDRD